MTQESQPAESQKRSGEEVKESIPKKDKEKAEDDEAFFKQMAEEYEKKHMTPQNGAEITPGTTDTKSGEHKEPPIDEATTNRVRNIGLF